MINKRHPIQSWEAYKKWAVTTIVYPLGQEREYLRLGLLSEYGELCAILKRKIRDGVDCNIASELESEAGDCFRYIAVIEEKLSKYAMNNIVHMVEREIEDIIKTLCIDYLEVWQKNYDKLEVL